MVAKTYLLSKNCSLDESSVLKVHPDLVLEVCKKGQDMSHEDYN
jgi:hypothetical protein